MIRAYPHDMDITARHLEHSVRASMDAFRAVVLHGARQSGKTTLARQLTDARGGTYLTLDDDAIREAALADPDTLITSHRFPLAIDEFQLGGDRLVRAIKRAVDIDPVPGRFLLTGSTNFLTLPTMSESLAGRVRILRLWPFSEAELSGVPSSLDRWFDTVPTSAQAGRLTRNDYLELTCRGGYPEVIGLGVEARRAWVDSYVETVTQRDIAALADIRKTSALPRLIRWVAANTSSEINIANAARDLGINRATITSYLEWLETVFLVYQIPVWSRKLETRAVRRPKLHLGDTGLAAQLLTTSATALAAPTAPATGSLLESFVVNEISRQLVTSKTGISLSHYRDNHGREVDLVLERADGATIAIEIKTTTSPTRKQAKHLAWFRDRLDAVAPGAFRGGILLHTGHQSATVGDRLHLLPIDTLWASPIGPSDAPEPGVTRHQSDDR